MFSIHYYIQAILYGANLSAVSCGCIYDTSIIRAQIRKKYTILKPFAIQDPCIMYIAKLKKMVGRYSASLAQNGSVSTGLAKNRPLFFSHLIGAGHTS